MPLYPNPFRLNQSLRNISNVATPLVGFGLNGSKNQVTKAMLARVKAGGRGKIVFMSDSLCHGIGTGTDSPKFVIGARARRLPTCFAQSLATLGVNAIDKGFVGDAGITATGSGNYSDFDPRVSVTGQIGISADLTFAGGGYWLPNGNGAWSLSFTETNVDTFEVVVYAAAATRTTVTIDGAAPPSGNAYFDGQNGGGFLRFVFPAGSVGTHTIKLTASGAAPAIRSIRGYAVGTPAIDMVVLGACGAQASQQASSDSSNHWKALEALAFEAPDLVVIQLGANDINNSVSTATTISNLQTIINTAKAGNADVLLCAFHPAAGNFASSQPSLAAAIKSLAQSAGVSLMSFYDYYGGDPISSTFQARLADNLVHAKADVYVEEGVVLAQSVRAMGAGTNAITPLPAGLVAQWDASSLSGLADGAAVTAWTDSIGGSVATTTGGGTPHTYIANSAGLPSVRLNGSDVLATTGTNAANSAMTSGERTMIVIARNFQSRPNGSANPVLVSSGTDTNILFEGDTTGTGFFNRLTSCVDPGVRSIAYCSSSSRSYGGAAYGADGINGTTLHSSAYAAAGGQIAIGGWKDASSGNTGKADIIAILIWGRALTAAEYKTVHRHYCDLVGQAYPGGANARNVSVVGDSLTAGQGVAQSQSWPALMAAGLNLPWGTWDTLAISGHSWSTIQNYQVPMLGNISAVTGGRSIVCCFEWANDSRFVTSGNAGQSEANAQAAMTAILAQDPNREIVFGTSTDDGSSAGVSYRDGRDSYNAYWDVAANRSSIAGYVQLHLDPNIGLRGVAPTDGNPTTYYQGDGTHNTAAGYALIDSGPHGFRPIVQARLTA